MLRAVMSPERPVAAERDTAPSPPALPTGMGLHQNPPSLHQELPQKRETAPPELLGQGPGTAELWPRGFAVAAHGEAASRAVRTFRVLAQSLALLHLPACGPVPTESTWRASLTDRAVSLSRG